MQAALDLFEAEEWDNLVGQRSATCVAEMGDSIAQERDKALQAAAEKGQGGYALQNGYRRTLKGNTFKLNDARLFNILNPKSVQRRSQPASLSDNLR
jgi:MEKHLA domain